MSLFAGGTGSNVNLYSQIHKDQVTGVNLSEESVAKDIIKPWNERNSSTFIESNVDDQLIIYVPFITAVKLKSLLISTESGELRPDAVKIYTNLANCPDFGEVENSQSLQEISLERHSSIDNENPHSDHVVEYPLRVARFTNVFSCVLFFVSDYVFYFLKRNILKKYNQPSSVGRSVSRIYYVGFKGECLTPKRENSDRVSK